MFDDNYHTEHISQKKKPYPVSHAFRKYLKKYGREEKIPINYEMLRHFNTSFPLYDKSGKDTLWETVYYNPIITEEIHHGLIRTYSMLKSSGHTQAEEHLHIEKIDYCSFGNSKPFRIKIVNNYNEVYDYFYIKIADASRIVGMEIEHMLSPYWINYLINDNTLVEEHIAGVPGDMFIDTYLGRPEFNPKRIAKEFVKFNERCFIRLLGDMRSYNFVFDISQDFDDIQFRLRAIDFDQQSYEGRKNIYLPQYFKENKVFVDMVLEHFNTDVIKQYQTEERSLIIRRMRAQRSRLKDIKDVLLEEELSTPEKIIQLRKELAAYHEDERMHSCDTMMKILEMHMKLFLLKGKKEGLKLH